MGTLIAWHYPTTLFMKLADHTYVTCGNGTARWKCWGGDTGGKALSQGAGSTKRANDIAEPDERAGITCYLINGVCHQAANRILLPSGITVRGAKGYYVSESLFGTYGRPRGFLGMCNAPFHQHDGVTGELTECEAKTQGLTDEEAKMWTRLANQREQPDEGYQHYLARVQALYAAPAVRALAEDTDQAKQFQMQLFETLADYKLASSKEASSAIPTLMDIRSQTEDQRTPLEESLQAHEMGPGEFAERYNGLTIEFQEHVANALSADDYHRLLDLEPGDTVVLGDPDIVQQAYGEGNSAD